MFGVVCFFSSDSADGEAVQEGLGRTAKERHYERKDEPAEFAAGLEHDSSSNAGADGRSAGAEANDEGDAGGTGGNGGRQG